MRIHTKPQNRTEVLPYFRARLRAVAASVDLKLPHDVVHHATNVLPEFRGFLGLEHSFPTSKEFFFSH